MSEIQKAVDLAKQFAPELEDILDLQVTGNTVLIKGTLEEDLKTKGGVIIGDISSEYIRYGILQIATVVSVGSKVSEITPGMRIYYLLKDTILSCEVKDSENLYFMIQDYNIKAFIKP